jgi:bifunctional ADP-heptose synthase (sugar kinase/adenylyltransferase)
MDKYVGKGEGRPIIPEADRLEIIKGLSCVDEARLYPDGVVALKEIVPNIFCKGDDWKQRGLPKEITDFCIEKDIRIVFTNPNPHVTTGKVIERLQCVS